jgi:hypothetical protein
MSAWQPVSKGGRLRDVIGCIPDRHLAGRYWCWTASGWGGAVSRGDGDWTAGGPGRVSAGRDAYVAGRDQTVTNNYFAGGDSGVRASLRAGVDRAAEELAAAVGDQWRREERLRRVQDPVPLPVRWTAADPLLSDHMANIRGAADGDSGEIVLDGVLREVVDVFLAVPSRRLVVIGQPGAGKTVFTLRFTLDLLRRREPGEPVPVVFGLHTWDPLEQSLQEWMAARLAADYPGLRGAPRSGPTIAAELVRRRLVLPVLDGLDEVSESLRGDALRALNLSLDSGAPVIVTCREADYRELVAAADVLTSAAVIELVPLGLADLAGYLPRTTRKASPGTGGGFSTKWDPVLERLRAAPAAPASRMLLEALRTPLMTSLARAAYSDTAADPATLLDGGFASCGDIEDHLLDAFLPAVFAGPVAPDPRQRRGRVRPADAERWLRFLARHLNGLGTRDLEWWRLPGAVPPPVRWLAPGLVGWIAIGAAFGAVAGSIQAWSFGGCGAAGLVIGLAIITASRPPAAPSRVRAVLRRLGFLAATALPAGIIMGATTDLTPPGFISLDIIQLDGQSSIFGLSCAFLAGLGLGAVLGVTGIDAQQTPAITPLRLKRKLRVISRRLGYGIGHGLFSGVLTGLALLAAVGIGYASATALRIEATPAFPAGGSTVRYLPDGSSYADFPGGLRYVITRGGRRYITVSVTYAGFSEGYLDGYYLVKRDCLAEEDECTASTRNTIDGADFQPTVTGTSGVGDLLDAPGINNDWLTPPALSASVYGLRYTGLIALFFVAMASLAGGLLLWLGFPADVTQAVSPSSSLRADRNAAILRGVTFTPIVLLSLAAIIAIGHIWLTAAIAARYAIMIGALGSLAITLSAWARLQVARACLAASGRLPWHLMGFLEDAHARGALRQAGAAYQFRHIRLQERLTAQPINRANASMSRARTTERQ